MFFINTNLKVVLKLTRRYVFRAEMDSKADKLHHKALREQQKRLKPGECQKYVRLVVNTSIEQSRDQALGRALLEQLGHLQLNLKVRDIWKDNCVLWERNKGQRSLMDASMEDWEIESQVVMFLSGEDFQLAVKSKTLDNIGKQLRFAFPNKNYTVVILHDPKDSNARFNNALIELQVLQQLTVLTLPPNATEIAAFLQRFTKAISEAPFKQQKSEHIKGFKKFLLNDKKDCVRIVGDSGYKRLWQQHLNRLPMVTLTQADTIIDQFPCPKKLLEEYVSNPGALLRVANIKVKRDAVAPLQNERRIGDMLSSKLYTLYTTRDPDALI